MKVEFRSASCSIVIIRLIYEESSVDRGNVEWLLGSKIQDCLGRKKKVD